MIEHRYADVRDEDTLMVTDDELLVDPPAAVEPAPDDSEPTMHRWSACDRASGAQMNPSRPHPLDADSPVFRFGRATLRHHDAGPSLPHRANRSSIERRRSAYPDSIREGDVLLGKYRVERVTSESTVTVAESVHLEMGSRVLVTMLSPEGPDFPTKREHFLRTTHALYRAQSRHTARILDAGTLDSGMPFMVAQLVGANHLGGLIRDRGPLSVTDAVDFVLQMSEALAEAHDLGIVHGSIRPANIRIVSGIDGWPTVSLVGYGVPAQWSLSDVREHAPRMRLDYWPGSSIAYLAPEQIRRPQELDHRSDIWGLGVVIHEALAGEPPFRAEGAASLLAQIVADPIEPLSTWRSDVPRTLETLASRCLQKDPNARFPSLAEFVRELQPFASPEMHGLADRVARVVARHGSTPSLVSRSPHAIVHLKNYEVPNRPTSRAATTRVPADADSGASSRSRWSLAAVAALLVGVGVSAGVGGAVVVAKYYSITSPSRETDTSPQPLGPSLQVFAATPSPAASGAPTRPPPVNPITAAAVPVIPRTPIVRAKRPRELPAISTPEPEQSAESPKTYTSSAERPTKPVVASGQLFDDIK